jgi:hypothetical protein
MLTDLVQHPRSETSDDGDPVGAATDGAAEVPPIVREEQALLEVVLRKLDGGVRKARIQVDDASALIELRDALAEAKPEDQGSILEQMHRIEALSKQRGKGDSPPVDRKSPYFGHLRLEEGGKRRDVLIGARSFVEPGGGVQIVDWRNAPVSRLFYRYEEGDPYEERAGRSRSSKPICAGSRPRRGRSRATSAPGTGARSRRDRRAFRSRATAARWSSSRAARRGPPRCRRPARRPRRAASWASTTPARAGRTATCPRSRR